MRPCGETDAWPTNQMHAFCLCVFVCACAYPASPAQMTAPARARLFALGSAGGDIDPVPVVLVGTAPRTLSTAANALLGQNLLPLFPAHTDLASVTLGFCVTFTDDDTVSCKVLHLGSENGDEFGVNS